MSSLLGAVILILVLALPVRLAASWFGAGRNTWGASILVLFVGALLVNVAVYYLPEQWIILTAGRFVLVFVIFFVASALILDVKTWQAALLSAFIAVVYGFSVSPLGEFGVRIGL